MRVLKKAYIRPTDWKKNYVRYRSYFLDIAGRYKERTDIRVYLEILLSLTTISIFSIFALRPTLLTIGGLIKDIEAKKATLVKMDEKMKNLSQAQNLYDQEREKITLLEIAIPPNPSPNIFLRQIEGLASKHPVVVEKITLGKSTILGTEDISDPETKSSLSSLGAKEIPLLIMVETPIEEYIPIYNFLSDIENLQRPLKIDKLTLSLGKKEGGETLVLLIDGKIFYFSN